jgi:hypothetical protein
MNIFSKKRIRADVMASCLFDEFVKRPIHGAAEVFQIDVDVGSPSGRKLFLYQFASVMLAVLEAEQRDKEFLRVRDWLERQIFPPSFAQGADLLNEIRPAMRELAGLLEPDGQTSPLSWALRWVVSVGIEQHDLVTLHMFAMRWLDHYILVAKSLRGFRPVA